MNELLIMRHGQAEAAGPDRSDFQRPLSTHGQAQARAAGQWLDIHQATPDALLCSPATRAVMTAEAVGTSLPSASTATAFCQGIYDATAGELMALLQDHVETSRRLLVIGHNPGVQKLLTVLCPALAGARAGMAPASVAWLGLDGRVEPGTGHLHDRFDAE